MQWTVFSELILASSRKAFLAVNETQASLFSPRHLVIRTRKRKSYARVYFFLRSGISKNLIDPAVTSTRLARISICIIARTGIRLLFSRPAHAFTLTPRRLQ
jgi:hypothetical protein